MIDSPWFYSIFGGLIGSLIGIIAQSIIASKNMEHERKIALFQYEVSEIRDCYNTLVAATEAIDTYANAVIRYGNFDVQTRFKAVNEYHMTASRLDISLLRPPLTTNTTLLTGWNSYVKQFQLFFLRTTELERKDTPLTSDERRELETQASEIRGKHIRITIQLANALSNFEKGKPAFR